MKTLDDLIALNDHLAALSEAGVPIEIGLGELGQDAAGSLEEIDAAVSRQVARGVPLVDSIESDENGVPAAYRSMVLRGMRTGSFSDALDGANRLAESVDDARHVVRSAFVYPVIVCAMAYAGMIGFCLFFVPVLERAFEGLRIEPGSGLNLLRGIRETLPYWVAIPPVALLVLVEWQHRTRIRHRFSVWHPAGVVSWRRSGRRSVFLLQCATFSETLASLTEKEVPFGDALPIASGAAGNASLTEGSLAIANSLEEAQDLPNNGPATMRFPPFLRWALLSSEKTIGRSRALRMAAVTYQKAAERRAERSRIVVPMATCAVIGGGVTLLYGLALFVPVVQMLEALAQ